MNATRLLNVSLAHFVLYLNLYIPHGLCTLSYIGRDPFETRGKERYALRANNVSQAEQYSKRYTRDDQAKASVGD